MTRTAVQDQFSGDSDDQWELALGKVTGYRRWYVLPDGSLNGAASYLWVDGEQHAGCAKSTLEVINKIQPALDRGDEDLAYELAMRYKDNLLRDHDMSACTCGFYAYHRPRAAFGSGSMVLGAMRGWGKVAVGEKGFRSEWAEPVALLRPRRTDPLNPLWLVGLAAVTNVVVILALSYLMFFVDPIDWSQTFWIAIQVGLLIFNVRNYRRYRNTRRQREAEDDDPFETGALQARYPNVRIYTSKRKMLRDFPATGGKL